MNKYQRPKTKAKLWKDIGQYVYAKLKVALPLKQLIITKTSIDYKKQLAAWAAIADSKQIIMLASYVATDASI